MDEIRYANNLSPRSKENAINKQRIEHLIQRMDTAIQKRIASDLIQEREDDYERSHQIHEHAYGVSDSLILSSKTKKRAKIMNATDKLTIIHSKRNEVTK